MISDYPKTTENELRKAKLVRLLDEHNGSTDAVFDALISEDEKPLAFSLLGGLDWLTPEETEDNNMIIEATLTFHERSRRIESGELSV